MTLKATAVLLDWFLRIGDIPTCPETHSRARAASRGLYAGELGRKLVAIMSLLARNVEEVG